MKSIEASFQQPKKERAISALEREYNFPEIKALEKPIENLVGQLKEAIDKGEYDVLIGDDTSGRIPTLILRKIFRKRYEQLNPKAGPEEKQGAPKAFYVAGGSSMHDVDLTAWEEFFKKIKPEVKTRALLVTEFMSSGRSVFRMGGLLEEAGIPFDIASVIAKCNQEEYAAFFSRSFFKDHRFFIGQRGQTPLIWNMRELAGVQKKWGEAQARPEPTPVITYRARKDAKVMVDKILKSVWGQK